MDKIKQGNKVEFDFKSFIAFIAFAVMFGATYLITTEMAKTSSAEDWVYIAIQVVTYVIYLVVLFTTILKNTWNRITWTLKNEFEKVIKAAAIATAVYMVLNFGVSLIGKALIESLTDKVVGSSENQDTINTIFEASATGAFVMGLTTIIIGPITEEIAFRKGIIGASSKSDSPFVRRSMIVLSVILFGSMHVFIGGDWQNILPYLTMGSVLAYVYVKYNDNITYTIMTHIFVNTVSVLLMLITK